MFKNNLKIAWRNLKRNKSYFSINVLGLSIALTFSFLMLLWVHDEYSIDKFHSNGDRLYRVKRTSPSEGGALSVYNGISYPLLKTAKEKLPEIKKYITLGYSNEDNLKVENIDLRATGTFANADFFTAFSFPILVGEIDQLDKKLESIAISESLAHRFWGDGWMEKAMGSRIKIGNNGNFTVEAVYADFPESSSIQNDFYYSFDKYLNDNDWLLEWGNNRMQGAFLLEKDADLDQVSVKLNDLFQANIKGENKEGAMLQKFSDAYLYGQFDEKAQASGGRIEYVMIFAIAAIFLLLISCINFINLSTAHALDRSSEIGIRKAIGAGKKVLIKQFLTETAMVTSISFAIAYVLSWLLLPSINDFVDKKLEIGWSDPGLWLSILILFAITTLLSGLYPSIVISSFKPVTALKGKGQEKKNTISLRKSLVVLQFGLAILMIVAAITVRKQVDYINGKDLGLTKDHILSINKDEALDIKYEAFRNEMISSDAIEDVTLASPSPLDMGPSTNSLQWAGKTNDQQNIEFSLLWTAHNFPEVFDIPLHQGSYYREGSTDTLNIVVNQKAVDIMGIKNPIGKTFQLWGQERQILGVLKDFHNQSLHKTIQPAIFFLEPNGAGTMFVKIKAEKTKEAVADMHSTFARFLPDIPLHYNFVEEQFAQNYKSETLTGTLVSYFAFISILISCLGLFGLATFMAKHRIKEIGIRKVLGASVASITTLISIDFLKLVGLAILIASPLAYYLMRGWLDGFAYRIEIKWWIFGLAGLLTVLIAFATIAFQAIKAALANPVKSLRTE